MCLLYIIYIYMCVGCVFWAMESCVLLDAPLVPVSSACGFNLPSKRHHRGIRSSHARGRSRWANDPGRSSIRPDRSAAPRSAERCPKRMRLRETERGRAPTKNHRCLGPRVRERLLSVFVVPKAIAKGSRVFFEGIPCTVAGLAP